MIDLFFGGAYTKGFSGADCLFFLTQTYGGSDVRRTTCFWAMLFLAASATAWAAPIPIINVGGHDLLSGGSPQTFALYASGDVAVQGLNFYIQIGDGGAANGGSGTKPIITNVDIVGPARSSIGPATLFDGNNTGQFDISTTDLLWAVSTTTNSGTVATSDTRTLAFVTIDTAGTAVGETYPLLLSGVGGGVDTDFAGIGANITNGSIRIVPEPSTLALLASLVALLPAVVWRRKRLAA